MQSRCFVRLRNCIKPLIFVGLVSKVRGFLIAGKVVVSAGGQNQPESEVNKFTTDGRVEVDNNHVDNAIRPTALGKRNWLFVGEAGAGDRVYRRPGIYPYAYLKDVLNRLPSMTNRQLVALLP